MSGHQVRWISTENIKSSVQMKDVIPVVRDAFIQLSEDRAIVPLRINIPFKDKGSDALIMPVFLPDENLVGVKLITLVEKNPLRGLPLAHALIIVMDAKNGLPLAILDGEYLTALRTGAGSGVATDILARKNASVAAIFGAGTQGRTQLEAICAVRPIDKVYIFEINPDSAVAFGAEMSEKLNVDISLAEDQNVLGEVDIICTATASNKPVFNDSFLQPGVHINAIGSYRPDMVEIPSETINRAKNVVDARNAVLTEAGDFVQPIEAGLFGPDVVYGEIGEIAAGRLPGRLDFSEITLFKSVGNAVQDLATAGRIIKLAEENDFGILLDL